MTAVKGFLVLLFFQLLGELITYAANLPVPGPVLGMLFLLLALIAYGKVPDCLRSTATGLLAVLSLLLVPPSVGLIAHIGILTQYALPIGVALVVSTLVPMVLVAWVLRTSVRRKQNLQVPDEGRKDG